MSLRLELKHPFLQPADPTGGFTSFTEKMRGTTTVTLKRLGR